VVDVAQSSNKWADQDLSVRSPPSRGRRVAAQASLGSTLACFREIRCLSATAGGGLRRPPRPMPDVRQEMTDPLTMQIHDAWALRLCWLLSSTSAVPGFLPSKTCFGAAVIPWRYQYGRSPWLTSYLRSCAIPSPSRSKLHLRRAREALPHRAAGAVPPDPGLEEELKAHCLRRTSRATGLTPAGRQLLADSDRYGPCDALPGGHPRCPRSRLLPIGFMPGLIVTDAVAPLASLPPAADR